jgi:hypothetical protein
VDDVIAATYRARFDGIGRVEVKVTLGDGWHTFSMDNQIRAEEALAGKKAIGMDRPTSFVLSGGLEGAGGWMQSPLRNFSKPELRIFSWGFEKEARFTGKAVKAAGAGPAARMAIKAQACTESICKNIDTVVEIPLGGAPQAVDTAGLESVRTK